VPSYNRISLQQQRRQRTAWKTIELVSAVLTSPRPGTNFKLQLFGPIFTV
jgi:hypothetical protein